jgi:DNA-binding transcriptional LysR family regulator
MRMFQAVVDAQSFTAAAAELGVSQSMVSRAVVRLEQRLGTALLLRSTRRISLTDEGTIFLQGCRRILEDIKEVERSVTSDTLATGTLRINAPILKKQSSPFFRNSWTAIQNSKCICRSQTDRLT